jgi:hypothetical protein
VIGLIAAGPHDFRPASRGGVCYDDAMKIRTLVGCGMVAGAMSLLAADYPVQPVPFTAVRVTGGFWRARQEINRTVTVPFALQQCEDTGRMKNFDLAADTMRRRINGSTPSAG